MVTRPQLSLISHLSSPRATVDVFNQGQTLKQNQLMLLIDKSLYSVTTYQEERRPEDEIGGGDDHVHLDPRDPLRLQVLDVALDLDALRRRDGQQVLAVLTHNITLSSSSSSLPKIWNFFCTGFSQSKI